MGIERCKAAFEPHIAAIEPHEMGIERCKAAIERHVVAIGYSRLPSVVSQIQPIF
jgi:hypothetical protein